jgi:hypothetical protein
VSRINHSHDEATGESVHRIHGHTYRVGRTGFTIQLTIDGEHLELSITEALPYRDAFGAIMERLKDEIDRAGGIEPRSGELIDPTA